jgi:two-component system, NarL family, response regulator DegU
MVQPNPNDLTSREVEVLAQIAQGMQNKEVARSLVISEATVENHLTSIYRKLNVNNRTQASLYALRAGLVD